MVLANGPRGFCAMSFLVHLIHKGLCDSFDRQACGLPFGIPVLEPADAIAARPQFCDSFEREDTIGPTAISDHFTGFRKFADTPFQFGKRNVERAWEMTKGKLVFGSHIKHSDQIVVQSRDQVITRDRFQRVASLKVVGHDTADLGNIPFADAAQSFDQRDHFGITSQPIQNVFAATLGLDQARPSQNLQVARGVGERQMRPRRQLLDTAHPLREVLQQLEPMSVTERLGHSSEILID